MKPQALLFLVAAALPFAARADAPKYPQLAPISQYLIADRQAEIALARSAAAPSISKDATVLVLASHGYEMAVKGTNGWVCFVERSWSSPFSDPEYWNPKERSPNCFNPLAARGELPQYLQLTRWALSGLTVPQIIEKTKAAVADHTFKAPEPGAFSLMMSKRGYLSDAAGGPWFPHVMLFIPRGQTNDWGPDRAGSPAFSQDRGEYQATMMMIPGRQWSDGTPAK
jgi:hypothetical protein